MAKKPELTDSALVENLPSWGVLVLESHHSPQFTMEWRNHAFLKLIYVLRGKGVLEFRDHIARFQEGDFLLVRPQTDNRIADAPDAASSLYVCCIATSLLAFDPGILDQLRDGLVPGGSHLSSRVATQLRRMRHRQSAGDHSVAISMVSAGLRLVEWVMQQREPDLNPPAIERRFRDDREVMVEYVSRLRTEFYEATTIDEAARSLAMSRRTFTKLFQDVTGDTWLTHVRRLAIQHAKHQLAQTNLSIPAVAFECGFNDLSTFYRQFKSHTGVSPKAYRKSVS
jgi:AraC family L-rhamnose operon regulatory protein RhaS